jgi:transaldolase / glucose-6-phosphate isomerase
LKIAGALQVNEVKKMNPLKSLQEYGQSVWLDYIRRNLITTGELKRLIEEDGLRGITSNPSIFEKAIAGSTDYEDLLKELSPKDLDLKSIYELLAIRDIQDAADVLRPVYEQTKRRDGFVSLEVSPSLANDTQGSIDEARRLWKSVGRPNVMIKIPGTPAGIPAIQQTISEGININITLLFSQAAYEQVVEAYISGLEKRVAAGNDISNISSVASFFVSRIDSMIDGMIAERLKNSSKGAEQNLLRSIQGKIAIANAKLTYQKYRELFSNERWQKLAQKGGATQRVLWASTSTKNPNYRDVLYIEELIGPDTVNTVPPATMDAFREHGKVRPSLTEGIEDARITMETLAQTGISMQQVTDRLLVDAVVLFEDAFKKLLGAIETKRKSFKPAQINRMTYSLPSEIDSAVKNSLAEWNKESKVQKLSARDASLWTNQDEANWMGWLGITEVQHEQASRFTSFAKEIRDGGFTHVLLLGMGGSSLCPEVMAMTFGKIDGYPELHILDSTDPAQLLATENKIDLSKTLFIVSSKSGSTLEPNIFKQYFFDRVKQTVGADEAGKRFIAITDPGSKMQQVAEADHFRHIFHGVPSIGGRYSALSDFGMIPAAAMGIEVHLFLDRTEEMVEACASCVRAEENPGVVLGTILGIAAKQGRDKVTFITSPGIYDLGSWLEQLIAESTGKEGKGLIPIDRENLASPQTYGNDRVFFYLRLKAAPDADQDSAVETLKQAGHPVVMIHVDETYDLGEEFFRWEIATAVAGSILKINPFNQPDVEASKIATRALTSEYEKTGSLPPEKPALEENGIKLFTDERNAGELKQAAGSDQTLKGWLRAHVNRIQAGDYFALLAYLQMNESNENILQQIRHVVRDQKHSATCLGFGPRFLHSTGQAYKGGPNTGVVLQVTCDDAKDIHVPGQKYTFGIVKAAQARGDFQVLIERGRRALRIHIGKDVQSDLKRILQLLQ